MLCGWLPARTKMRHLPKRTRSTGLTDDELILFDVMFDGGRCFESLRHSGFTERCNYPSHGFDDEQLRTTLRRFVDSGLLAEEVSQVCKGTSCFQLTPCGGRL